MDLGQAMAISMGEQVTLGAKAKPVRYEVVQRQDEGDGNVFLELRPVYSYKDVEPLVPHVLATDEDEG